MKTGNLNFFPVCIMIDLELPNSDDKDNIIDGGLEEELPNSMKKGLSRLHHVYLAICIMIDLELPNSDDKDNIIDVGLKEELPNSMETVN